MAKISTTGASAAVKAVAQLLDGGFLRVYSGAVPLSVDTPLAGNTLLAEIRFGSPAFAFGGADGVAVANPSTDDASADASGVPSFVRCFTAQNIPILDVDVDTDGLVVTPSPIVVTAPVRLSNFQLRQPI
jgi:hypothetical protein